MHMAHLGQNIARLRGVRRMTQKEMAAKLHLTQPDYSRIEQKTEIDDNLLAMIADVLEVSPETIKSFNENAMINNVSCNFNDNAVNTIYQFNPVDKLVELVEENRKLYEQLLKEKDTVIEMYKSQK